MKRFLLLIIILLSTFKSSYAQCILPPPSNLISTSQGSCSISVSWNQVSGAANYKLKYKIKNTSVWTKVKTGNTNSYNIGGLEANTEYKLTIASICSNNKTGSFSQNTTASTSSCPTPVGLTASSITTGAVQIDWQSDCPASSYALQYKQTSSSTWNIISEIPATTFNLSSLAAQTIYEVQIRAHCGNNLSAWTTSLNFQTANAPEPLKPNIVMIVLDDARYDGFVPTGGPSYLNYPSIDRIANEGVNFKITCPTTSLCTPSRGTIYTGLYAHKNGAIFNGDLIKPWIPQIQEILHDHGYYTGVIGKYSFANNFPPGYDWYAISNSVNYIDPQLQVNGVKINFTGNIADVYNALLQQFLNSIPPGKPFMLMFIPITPHGPSIPRMEDEDLYVNETIPFPSNFSKYEHNYPSFYYNDTHAWEFSASQTDSMRLIEFQTQQGCDMNINVIFSHLDSLNTIDSTLILFTSDNGVMKGEHLMQAKEVSLEESIRIPLFIRYPCWFNAHSVIDDQIASNMDFAPTILDAAHIPNTFQMDGISLRDLYTDAIQRKFFLYELCSYVGGPPIRAVRSLDYKYVYSFCDETVEEFYDFINDPLENTNQIFNPAYTSLIEEYRLRMDSLRVIFEDTLYDFRNCNLSHVEMKEDQLKDETSVYLYPNPTDNVFQLRLTGLENAELTIINSVGEVVMSKWISNACNTLQISCNEWPVGIYFVQVKTDEKVECTKLILQ